MEFWFSLCLHSLPLFPLPLTLSLLQSMFPFWPRNHLSTYSDLVHLFLWRHGDPLKGKFSPWVLWWPDDKNGLCPFFSYANASAASLIKKGSLFTYSKTGRTLWPSSVNSMWQNGCYASSWPGTQEASSASDCSLGNPRPPCEKPPGGGGVLWPNQPCHWSWQPVAYDTREWGRPRLRWPRTDWNTWASPAKTIHRLARISGST